MAGCAYLAAGDEVLRATTVSGTMVIGLGPPIYLMLFWRFNSAPGKDDGFRQAPLAFFLSWLRTVCRLPPACFVSAGVPYASSQAAL